MQEMNSTQPLAKIEAHSPTPWSAEYGGSGDVLHIVDRDGREVISPAICVCEEGVLRAVLAHSFTSFMALQNDDLKFMFAAINNHERLKVALQKFTNCHSELLAGTSALAYAIETLAEIERADNATAAG